MKSPNDKACLLFDIPFTMETNHVKWAPQFAQSRNTIKQTHKPKCLIIILTMTQRIFENFIFNNLLSCNENMAILNYKIH